MERVRALAPDRAGRLLDLRLPRRTSRGRLPAGRGRSRRSMSAPLARRARRTPLSCVASTSLVLLAAGGALCAWPASSPAASGPCGGWWARAARRCSTASPPTRAATSTSTCASRRTRRSTAASPRTASTRSPATTAGRSRSATTRCASATCRPRPGRAGARRVVVLGDSFAEGQGVKEADTVARALERLLETRAPGTLRGAQLRPPRDGLPGALRAFEEALAYEPDLVIYTLTLNDAVQPPEFRERQQLRQRLDPRPHPARRTLPSRSRPGSGRASSTS